MPFQLRLWDFLYFTASLNLLLVNSPAELFKKLRNSLVSIIYKRKSSKMSSTDNAKNRTLTIKKTFDAPVKLVWEAWTEADQIVQWWGP